MIKNYNDDFIISKGITNKGVIFFLQRWAEIFDQRTLTTYQYSIINIIFGMNEYLGVIDKTLDGSFTTHDNVETCRLELLRTIKEDDIILKYNPYLNRQIICNLGKSLNSKNDNRSTLLRVKNEICYALNLIEPYYFNWLMDELLDNIKNLDLKKIQLHLKVLASYCIYNGWTPHGASNLVTRLFISEEAFDLENVWGKFKESLNKDQSFTVYVNLKLNAKGLKTNDNEIINLIDMLGIKVYCYDDILKSHPDIESKKLPINSDKKYMLFKVKCKDIKSAALNSINSLNNKVTILTFYNKISPLSLNELDVFVINNENNYIKKFKISELYKTYLFQDSSNKVFENVMTLYADNNTNLDSTKSGLNCVFNYANISLVSIFPEEKFMNLWIALESFMRTGQYSNIISHVKEVLPSVICKRYIYRIVRNFAEDCIRCKISMVLSTGEINLNDDLKQRVVENLVDYIRDESTYNEMKTLCSSNSLLLYRLEELKQLFENNFSVISKIRRYYETILWHIQRLYRIRNEIAHSALKDDNYLISYIEHLYDFLAILIMEIVFVCSEKKIQSIEQIFPLLKDNYGAFDSTADFKVSFYTEFQLKNGIIDFL